MIRQVTFGFLISMMSSCLSLEYYTLPARAVGRLAFVRMYHLPHCSCCTTTDFYRRIVKIVWCWGPLTVQDLLVKFTKTTEVLIVIYSSEWCCRQQCTSVHLTVNARRCDLSNSETSDTSAASLSLPCSTVHRISRFYCNRGDLVTLSESEL